MLYPNMFLTILTSFGILYAYFQHGWPVYALSEQTPFYSVACLMSATRPTMDIEECYIRFTFTKALQKNPLWGLLKQLVTHYAIT